MSDLNTQMIIVDAQPRYLNEQSDPTADRYAFAYTITIHNAGTTETQLIDRHWIITDGNGKVQEVKGQGVIGEQPVIAPGSSHVYSSGCLLPTPVGTMEGSFGMLTDKGERYLAPVRVFRLAKPNVLN